jgi:hypothetical protein
MRKGGGNAAFPVDGGARTTRYFHIPIMLYLNHRGTSELVTTTRRDNPFLCWPSGSTACLYGWIARSSDGLQAVHFVTEDMSPTPRAYNAFSITGSTETNVEYGVIDLSPPGQWAYEIHVASGNNLSDIIIADPPLESGIIQVIE